MSTLCYRGKSVDIELNFHVDLLNFDLNNYTQISHLFQKYNCGHPMQFLRFGLNDFSWHLQAYGYMLIRYSFVPGLREDSEESFGSGYWSSVTGHPSLMGSNAYTLVSAGTIYAIATFYLGMDGHNRYDTTGSVIHELLPYVLAYKPTRV